MNRSESDESTYHRSPSVDSRDYAGAQNGFRRYSSVYGGQFGANTSFLGMHTNPGPKASKTAYKSAKGSKYVVFYLDLSFIFLLELKRCSLAQNCLQCLKYLMFVFNLLFWLAGCGILGVGIWLAVTQGNFATLSATFPFLSAANVLMGMGTVAMVVGFLGCVGAIKENKCLLLSVSIKAASPTHRSHMLTLTLHTHRTLRTHTSCAHLIIPLPVHTSVPHFLCTPQSHTSY
ncbi:uncharacterized protein LOC132397532 [Hypanus sabinus]|uniref:uncharacterized protein LOC132397532 n=1 Tax=Hypanus sabinus TaxID=79690 RepID=UPI0028C4210C|nr:uncharacterized protein LOC132397532 [Hypanus sabinus]